MKPQNKMTEPFPFGTCYSPLMQEQDRLSEEMKSAQMNEETLRYIERVVERIQRWAGLFESLCKVIALYVAVLFITVSIAGSTQPDIGQEQTIIFRVAHNVAFYMILIPRTMYHPVSYLKYFLSCFGTFIEYVIFSGAEWFFGKMLFPAISILFNFIMQCALVAKEFGDHYALQLDRFVEQTKTYSSVYLV